MKQVSFLLLILMQLLWSHGGEVHSSPPKSIPVVKSQIEHTPKVEEHSTHEHHKADIEEKLSNEFSSLHPLIVHFPIVLLLLLPFLLVSWMWSQKIEILWIASILSIVGSASAIVASTILHPHTVGMTEILNQILEKHDFWAYSTSVTSALSVIGILLLVRFPKAKTIMAFVLVSTIYAAVTVSVAGHYGATLTHIHGVGAQGKFIESEHSH